MFCSILRNWRYSSHREVSLRNISPRRATTEISISLLGISTDEKGMWSPEELYSKENKKFTEYGKNLVLS